MLMFALIYAWNEILIVKQCDKIKSYETVILITKSFILFGFFNPVASTFKLWKVS